MTCSINGVDINLDITAGSRLAGLHDAAQQLVEHTTCNYGLNVDTEHIASTGGMAISAVDDLGEIRAVERTDHPFFMGTLYQPQLKSSADTPHPVFVGLVRASA